MAKDSSFVAMGMAALMPGMAHMVELMQGELDRMRQMLEAAQNGDVPVKRGPGRPPKNPDVISNKSGWNRFKTAEARSQEMLRRAHPVSEIEKGRSRAGCEDRDPESSGHEGLLGEDDASATHRGDEAPLRCPASQGGRMTRLSNRQYPMLKALCDNGSDEYMSISEAQRFDQRPFRSMLIRGWCAYRAGRGFHVTREGKEAMIEFETTDIARKNPRMPLTAYFDPTAYGLGRKPDLGKKVHQMVRRATA